MQAAPLQVAKIEIPKIENDRRKTLQQLAQRVRAIEQSGKRVEVARSISSGCIEIDQSLPAGGYSSGSLVEWLCDGSGSGVQWLALHTAKQAIEGGKYLLVVDQHRRFYPIAAAAMGLPLDRVIVVHPHQESDVLWSIDQGLRCPAVGAVLGQVDRLDDRDARRLQLAAEQGGSLGLLTRQVRLPRSDSVSRSVSRNDPRSDFSVRDRVGVSVGIPSWADVQWRVVPQPLQASLGSSDLDPNANCRRLDLQLLRCRGGRAGVSLSLILDGDRGGILRCEKSSRTEGTRHASQSALCLASELALSTHAAKRSVAHRATLRVASA